MNGGGDWCRGGPAWLSIGTALRIHLSNHHNATTRHVAPIQPDEKKGEGIGLPPGNGGTSFEGGNQRGVPAPSADRPEAERRLIATGSLMTTLFFLVIQRPVVDPRTDLKALAQRSIAVAVIEEGHQHAVIRIERNDAHTVLRRRRDVDQVPV